MLEQETLAIQAQRVKFEAIQRLYLKVHLGQTVLDKLIELLLVDTCALESPHGCPLALKFFN